MNIVEKKLEISQYNAEQFLTPVNIDLNQHHFSMQQRRNTTPGQGILNHAAKEELFPSSKAHPFKMDSIMISQVAVTHGQISLYSSLDVLHTEKSNWTVNKTFEKMGITGSVVDRLSLNSDLHYELKPHNKGTMLRLDGEITLYFHQYECFSKLADTSSGGITTSVSDQLPFEGEQVTFSAIVDSNTKWIGWYSDPEGTQLLSHEQNYTTDAADLILYAKGESVSSNTFYVKENGIWKQKRKAYTRINGAWNQLSFDELKQELNKRNYVREN